MSARTRREGRAQQHRPLRVASHNMGGLRTTEGRDATRLEAAVQLWIELGIDVVCLQETHHVDERDQTVMEQALRCASERRHHPGWTVAAPSWSSAGPRTAGVAILIRANLLTSIANQPEPLPAGVPSGWFTSCKLQWGGHRLRVCNAYFPQRGRAGVAALRRQLCEQCLAPTAADATADGSLLLWCGDFNFVENPALDSSAGADGRAHDAAPSQLLQAAGTAAAMVDSFRLLHPQRREFTHLYRAPQNGGSRLDRIYTPAAASPYIIRAFIHTASPADHRPALLHLAPRYQPPNQKVPGRQRLHFLAHRDLKRRMGEWLDEQATAAPGGEDPAQQQALLDWWEPFKRRLTAQISRLNKEAVMMRSQPSASVLHLTEAAKEAANALDANPRDADRLTAAVDAQVAVQKAMYAAAGADRLAARRESISIGERPSPALTALVHDTNRGGGGGSGPTMLRDSRTGDLVSDPTRLPQIIANYWQEVSALPTEEELPDAVKQQAREQVLEALRQHPLRMPTDDRDPVGRPEVSSTEVLTALKATQRGRAPGWDGLPAELYKAFSRQFGPLLAALFTAIGTTRNMPGRFTEGIIKVLYKKGDPTQPGNYRPITLLNTDYRTLAKVLAARLGPALNAAISAEQTAFLPGRRIGCNIFALRHLPYLLRRQGRAAIIAFLDFAKAYDTVHRDALLDAMAVMGASEQLCSWTRTLLSDTRARALVGGRLSEPVTMAAGVRQGCPLAPLLYLFVAQALQSWLQSKQLGIRLDPAHPERTAAVQFADDGQALLGGDEAVQPFCNAMQTFAEATGQRLNHDKVELLRIGGMQQQQPQPQQPQQQQQMQQQAPIMEAQPNIAGLRLVPSATALGISYANSPQLLQPDRQRALATARQRMHRLTLPRLSAFGRCAGVSAYALQLNAYHWEHGGLPAGAEAEQLESWAAGVGDRRVSPLAPSQRLTGVPRQLLYGSPRAGGFGLLPLTHHVRAREAVWAATLALSAGQPAGAAPHPYTRIIAQYLRHIHPLYTLSSVLTTAGTTDPHPCAESPPAEISRILGALSHLPPVQDVETTPLPAAGDWCYNVPLWGNPLLPNAGAADATDTDGEGEGGGDSGGRGPGGNTASAAATDPDFQLEEEAAAPNTLTRPGLDCRHTRLAACTALRTLGDAVTIYRAAQTAPSREWDEWVQTHLAPRGMERFRRDTTIRALSCLLADVNAEWRAAAEAVRDHPERKAGLESEEELRARFVGRVGWRIGGSLTAKLRSLSVGLATRMQLQPVAEHRARLHTAYEQEARQQPPTTAADPAPPSSMSATLQRLWPIKWDREHKETLWRLAVDGVPMPGNTHLRRLHPEPCGCGEYGGIGPQYCSPRAHHFWECPVAQAVVQQIAAHAPGPITRANVWLAEAPAGMQQCVWDVVALAALSAMERTRVGLRTNSRQAADPGDPNQPDQLETAKGRAVLDFWQRVRGFAELGTPRRGWEGVGPDHPILSVDEEGNLRCTHPADVETDD